MENPDLVLQETGSRPTYSRLNYVPSGDTLHRDAISSFIIFQCEQYNKNVHSLGEDRRNIVTNVLLINKIWCHRTRTGRDPV